MGKVDEYIEKLKHLKDWEAYLLAESGLPGRRANIELGKAVAQTGNAEQFYEFLKYDVQEAQTNSPYEFLVFCGVLGLGQLLARGDMGALGRLRSFASDPRWRVREAVAMALQHYGQANPGDLLAEMEYWSVGNVWEQRAAAAAVCEPDFLVQVERISTVFDILDHITKAIERYQGRLEDGFQVLKKGMGYCWSVAVVAAPEEGKTRFERWFASRDPDVRWVLKENLKKKRMLKMDTEWVEKWRIMIEV